MQQRHQQARHLAWRLARRGGHSSGSCSGSSPVALLPCCVNPASPACQLAIASPGVARTFIQSDLAVQIASEGLKGRVIEVSLADLQKVRRRRAALHLRHSATAGAAPLLAQQRRNNHCNGVQYELQFEELCRPIASRMRAQLLVLASVAASVLPRLARHASRPAAHARCCVHGLAS
jgi:hypothetical protein